MYSFERLSALWEEIMYIKDQQENTSFAINAQIAQATLSDLKQQGEELFDIELELLGRSNPYLLAAVARVANIFDEIQAEIACMQGALLVYHMVGLSLEEKRGAIPQVTEQHMFQLIQSIDPTEISLERFVDAQVMGDTQEKFLLESMHEVYSMFHLDRDDIVAFGTGMVMTYDMLRIAEGKSH